LRFRRGLRQHFLAAAKVFETPQFAELRLGNRAETGWFCGTVVTDADGSIKIIRIIRVIEMGTPRYLKIVCVYGKHNDEGNLYIFGGTPTLSDRNL
jgi:hypothetical protein